MSRVKIETLTPVHIGSGEMLQFGNDFVRGKYNGSDVLGVVDDRKVMELIGEEHLNNWVAAINRGESTQKVVQQYVPEARVSDYSKRIIALWVNNLKSNDTLKESIHDGMGKPYIPGSSLKGAIRTAVLSTLAKDKTDLNYLIQPPKVNAKRVEEQLLGNNSNADIFRFLQVGDAFFDEYCGIALRMVNINERDRQSFLDTSKPQLVEAIYPKEQSEFIIHLHTEQYDRVKKWDLSKSIHSMPPCMNSMESLFKTINRHTKSLLEWEIKFWEERQDKDDSGVIIKYLNRISEMLNVSNECVDGESCVLRVGHGSGWRFITGAWSTQIRDFENVIVPKARPRNDSYKQYPFPKTRRVDSACGDPEEESCELLGFVKLSLKA